jgi:co-chaperonin GroES (HSP10)
VLVRPDKPTTNVGNIILPDAFVENTNSGTVLIAGIKSTISVGTQIVYMKDEVVPLDYNGEPVLLVKNERIYAVL